MYLPLCTCATEAPSLGAGRGLDLPSGEIPAPMLEAPDPGHAVPPPPARPAPDPWSPSSSPPYVGPILDPPPDGTAPLPIKGCQANKVIKRFRLLDVPFMDITHGLGEALRDEQGKRLTFDWRGYIRSMTQDQPHPAVGTGITRFYIERLADIKDANTKATPARVDFVIHQASGHIVRMHPHKHMTDADILWVEPQASNPFFKSHLARDRPGHTGGLARGAPLESPEGVPLPTPVLCTMEGLWGLRDKIGRAAAQEFITGLEHDCQPIDLCDGRLFSWPRFLASMDPCSVETVVGTGITFFEARTVPGTEPLHVFVVYRSDGTLLALWPGANRLGISKLVDAVHYQPEDNTVVSGVKALLHTWGLTG